MKSLPAGMEGMTLLQPAIAQESPEIKRTPSLPVETQANCTLMQGNRTLFEGGG